MYLYELLSIPICVDIQILSKCLFQNLCEYYLIQYIYRMLNCQSVTNVCSSTSPQPRATSELQCQVNFTSSSQWCMMQHNCHACHAMVTLSHSIMRSVQLKVKPNKLLRLICYKNMMSCKQLENDSHIWAWKYISIYMYWLSVVVTCFIHYLAILFF